MASGVFLVFLFLLPGHATYWLSKRHFYPRAMAWGCVCVMSFRDRGGSTSSVRVTSRRERSGYCLVNSGDVKSKKLVGFVDMTDPPMY